jgi:hypothetical protein
MVHQARPDRPPVPVASPQRHVQCVQHQAGALGGGGGPADDGAGEDVHDECDVDDAGPGGHVGEVGHPATVRRNRGEVPLQQVIGPFVAVVADGGGDLAAAAGSGQP